MNRRLAFVIPTLLVCGLACGNEAGGAAPPIQGAQPVCDPSTNGSAVGPNGTTPTGSPKSATIRIHYPVGTRRLIVRGDGGPLDWVDGTPAKDVGNDTWEVALGDISSPVRFLPILDGKRARGPAYPVSPGQTLDVYPHFEAAKGTTQSLGKFHSNIRNNDRGLRIYLPPSYAENTAARYPVIYMHDGQVIFSTNIDALDGMAKQFFGAWNADTALDEGVEHGTLPEAIIVGVDIIVMFAQTLDLNELLAHLTEIREQELTPTNDETPGEGRPGSGKGVDYLRMIVEEIKPMIDGKYRTLPDRDHTFMVGSSLGGLMSIWAGIDHGDTFGGIVGMSNSAWWDKEVAMRHLKETNGGVQKPNKVYVDTGDTEAGTSAEAAPYNLRQVEEHRHLWQAYRDVGFAQGSTFMPLLEPGAQHKGDYWSVRLPSALAFVMGSGR